MPYVWDFSAVTRNWTVLLSGLGGTIMLSLAGIALGILIGAGLAAMRLSGLRALKWPATAWIEFFRNTPPLVHFFWFFYGLPMAFGITLSSFGAALAALGIQSSAFFAEVFRGGIVSVERGQWEAGRALGMSRTRLFRRIILPQAARRMAAPFVERCFELVKTTTLAAALAHHELLYAAMVVVTETYRPLEVYTVVAILFLTVLFAASQVSEWLEARGRAMQGR
ncbi:amino acid ABC transporter permease [Prosthecodimorpha staleyi]|uniref:Amino acid ABC transporter permease n=1 Tax=Prosthecodimorpha staleyi TaxID=2840188 RepID=A0A947GDB6_9HYPH|nr:amino acid ABC transporter permease [Prosthecodimorpha staleyi]MBT9288095.1 amino acid ABC transporter permease [Prosthecodimorpha staleyi]